MRASLLLPPCRVRLCASYSFSLAIGVSMPILPQAQRGCPVLRHWRMENNSEKTETGLVLYLLIFRLNELTHLANASRIRITGNSEGYLKGVEHASCLSKPTYSQEQWQVQVDINSSLLQCSVQAAWRSSGVSQFSA